MAAIAVPVAAHTSSLLAAAMLFVGTLLPLPFIYVRAFGWVWPSAESSQPGLEWSAWEYYDHRSNYYLENGR